MSLATDFAAGRRAIALLLPDSCAIQSLIGATSDGAGGTTGGTWTTQATVACQASPPGKPGQGAGREMVVADGVAEVYDMSIAVPVGTAISAPQRVVHTDAVTGTVTTYDVISVSKPQAFDLNRVIAAKVVT